MRRTKATTIKDVPRRASLPGSGIVLINMRAVFTPREKAVL